MSFTYVSTTNIANIPQTPGVYIFKGKEGVLYIGKAGNLKTRVKTHFAQPTWRDNLFINQTTKVGYESLTSEIEALLKEAELIRTFSPKYNVLWKDNKNFLFVEVTRDPLPRVLLVHQPDPKAKHVGPFVDSRSIRRTLRTLRWVFPYYTKKRHGVSRCQECQLGICPGPDPDSATYKANVRKLVSVLSGKHKSVMRQLEKEMKSYAATQNYELASHKRDQLQALVNVFEHSYVLSPLPLKRPKAFWPAVERELREVVGVKHPISRIETYDISNTQGKEATGSMVVFKEGRAAKDLYRKFKIRMEAKPDDFAMLRETLGRRFRHAEWKFPDLVVIDGGKGQLSSAVQVRNEAKLAFPIVSLAKKHNELFLEGRSEPVLLSSLTPDLAYLILFMRDEAHRFAVTYHRKLTALDLVGKKRYH